MKAAKDRREDFYDPERKGNVLGRNKRRLELWEEHLKDPIVALDKALKCVENSCKRVLLVREPCGGSNPQWPASASFKVCGRKPICEGVWLYLDPMDGVCLRTASVEWNVPGKFGPHGELFFFQIQKEPALAPVGETFLAPSSLLTSALPFFFLRMSSRSALLAYAPNARKKRKGGEEWLSMFLI